MSLACAACPEDSSSETLEPGLDRTDTGGRTSDGFTDRILIMSADPTTLAADLTVAKTVDANNRSRLKQELLC
jgi:hypothetical protein